MRNGLLSNIGSCNIVAQTSFYKIKIHSVQSNHISDKFCCKTHLQNIPDNKTQAAWIRIIIHVIEKCVHVSFVRSITRSRQDVLRDPLRDRDPLDRALMTSLDSNGVQFPISVAITVDAR